MFIWRGFGLAVIGIAFVVLVLNELGIEWGFADEGYYQAHSWPKLLALSVSAVLVWLLATQLENRPGRVVIDKDTGEEITLRAKHDLFFIPLRYWPIILVAVGIGFMVFE